MNIIALICARGNSRGIKNKNLLKFNKISLLGHAIKQSFKSKFIKRVIVSTDSIKIAKEAKKYKAEIPFMRPAKLASSKSAEIETWRHAITNLSAEKKYDYIVSVPTTSPLRSIDDINKCISKAIKGNFDMVFTVTNSTKSPYYNILEIKNNKLQKVCGDKQKIVRRQDSPKCYDLTTVCYVFKPEYILKQKNWLKGKTSFIVIPKERSIDIDDKVDYKIAKILGQKYL
jgi:CMP-N,N'-diacetyllegionaminic acid synthase